MVEFVDPVHGFDHDALDAQVVTPDALDEGGVMHTFDPDPAAAGNARWRMRHGERSGCGLGARGARWLRGDRTDKRDRDSVEQESGGQHGELAPGAMAVFEDDSVASLA